MFYDKILFRNKSTALFSILNKSFFFGLLIYLRPETKLEDPTTKYVQHKKLNLQALNWFHPMDRQQSNQLRIEPHKHLVGIFQQLPKQSSLEQNKIVVKIDKSVS